MEHLATFKDKQFDLAIVDPPYGIGVSQSMGEKSGQQYGKASAPKKLYITKDWDSESPKKEYFNELIRVSKNQIIFGANHFISKIPFDSKCWIVWDKVNGENEFADCELA
jgi:site-specific DNA-methyltransferase (adenine-specific)